MTTLEVLVAKSKAKAKKKTESKKTEPKKAEASTPEPKTPEPKKSPPQPSAPAPEKVPPAQVCQNAVECSCSVCNPDIVDPQEEAKDAEFAFNLTSFVMIVSAIFVVFGGFYVAKKHIPFSADNFYFRYHFAQQALVVGFLLMEVGILMKLYALLSRLQVEHASDERSLSDWFLKVAAATFIVASAAMVIFSAIIRARELSTLAAALGHQAGLLLRQAADTIALQSFGMAAIFLLLAILALVHVLYLRLFDAQPSA